MLNACTIIACNYLPFATVLADSFFAHHPDGPFTVLLIDDEARRFAPPDGRVDWRRLGDLGIDAGEIRRLVGIYDVTELATAVKPLLLRTLLDEGRDGLALPGSRHPHLRLARASDEPGARARHRAHATHDAALSSRRRSVDASIDPGRRRLQPGIHRRRRARETVSRLVVGGHAAGSAERSRRG